MKTDTVLLFKPDIAKNPNIKPQKKTKNRWQLTLGIILALIPTLIALVYFGLIASNQYVTEIRFAVRSNETQQIDPLGMLTGLSGGSNLASDSYIVVNYIQSRAAVDHVEKIVSLRDIFSDPSIDWWSRFDKDEKIEYLTRYWKNQINARYDAGSNLIRVQVKAFTPKDSFNIAAALLSDIENLINRLSQKARSDAVKGADEEVKRAELRLRLVRVATRLLREKEQVADPVKSAGSKQEMIAKAQGELAGVSAEISAAKRFMKEESPSILVLRSRQKAIEEQIKLFNEELAGKSSSETITKMLANFEELEAEKQFAEKAYGNALASLERSRVEADRMQRYLAVFVRPSLAEYPLYPKRMEMVLVICALGVMLWALAVFIVQTVRDHL